MNMYKTKQNYQSVMWPHLKIKLNEDANMRLHKIVLEAESDVGLEKAMETLQYLYWKRHEPTRATNSLNVK